MKNEIEAMITDITATTAEAEDYTGEDGLLYCGKCHTPKEAYFAEGKTCFERDRHPTDCDCQRAAREKQQAVCQEVLLWMGFQPVPEYLPDRCSFLQRYLQLILKPVLSLRIYQGFLQEQLRL